MAQSVTVMSGQLGKGRQENADGREAQSPAHVESLKRFRSVGANPRSPSRPGSTGADPQIEPTYGTRPLADGLAHDERCRTGRVAVGDRGPKTKKLGGLRYVEAPPVRIQPDTEEIEARARDAGFADEAAHQRWRSQQGISGTTQRRRR